MPKDGISLSPKRWRDGIINSADTEQILCMLRLAGAIFGCLNAWRRRQTILQNSDIFPRRLPAVFANAVIGRTP
jgi:hypothetical protein